MGTPPESVPAHVWRLMSPEDRARYEHPIQPKDIFTNPGIHLQAPVARVKSDVPEIAEQREFAKWCAAQGYRAVWHKTHKRSTANRGCPDFIVGAKAHTFWLEFKRPGEELAPDQSVFKLELERNGITMHVCYSCAEAQAVIQQYKDPRGVVIALDSEL